MAVLVEAGDTCLPPRKRFRFFHSQPVPPLMATPLDTGLMLNGIVDPQKNHSPDGSEVSPVATLCNLGNTCFLNSVLYTLRFAPSLLHNLHHLSDDLLDCSSRSFQLKCKSLSLGRGISSMSKAWSSKDLTFGQSTPHEDKIVLATLRLHQLYTALHNAELKEHIEPYQPEVFLTALRDVNSIFEGNQQHDAHELLVCLLDNIRETCQQVNELQRSIVPPTSSFGTSTTKTPFSSVRKSLKLGKGKNGSKDKKTASHIPPIISDGALKTQEDEAQPVSHNFISDDFQGVTQLRTTCLECEQVTERKETFCDICVPITTPSDDTKESVSEQYHSAIVTEEFLMDTNKYWCELCGRYNEARRCVRFETLPRLLILQLKRFKSTYGFVVSKVNDYMPTPLILSCFCVKCKDVEESKRAHRGYELYGVIMHLGATMASGHYVTYVCSRDTTADCASCTRDKRETSSLSGSSSNGVSDKHSGGLFRFFKSTRTSSYPGNPPGTYFSVCRSSDCCGVKMDPPHEPLWLECDDETVRTLTQKQLEDILTPKSAKNSTLTPYLLFYSRLP